jgi:ubiquinone/menaquinone biosynthesis C-methylase UbiE
MKNRYSNILSEYNQDIIDLVPYNPLIFTLGAKEIEKIYRKNSRVLEIGTGEGDSALPILKLTQIKLDLLDVSKEMLTKAKIKLRAYKDRTTYICEDAYSYLKDSLPYDIIFSAWTVHNFKDADKERLLNSIYNNLSTGGSFILMDKVYPQSGGADLLERQSKRFSRYLPLKVAKAIIAHEIQDSKPPYRLDEKYLLKLLAKIGFRSIFILDRVERDILLIARK